MCQRRGMVLILLWAVLSALSTSSALKLSSTHGSESFQSWTSTSTQGAVRNNSDSSHNRDPISVYVVPHSHCDTASALTFEETYTEYVKHILDQIFESLEEVPSRRFSWAETAFFQMWYSELSSSQKSRVKNLVASSRFSFVGGGVTEPEEGVADPYGIVEVFSTGHSFIRSEFGKDAVPETAWQVDSYGHHASTPSLFKSMGFDNLVISRVSDKILDSMKRQKKTQFFWKTPSVSSDPAGGNDPLFTHVLQGGFCSKKGFEWEHSSGIEVTDKNIHERAAALAEELEQQAANLQTRKILYPFGCRFSFRNATKQFSSMEKIMSHIRSRSEDFGGMSIHYATPREYFAAVKAENLTFSVYDRDFYPYSNVHGVFTGLFTSQPALKSLTRDTEALLKAADTLFVLARTRKDSVERVKSLSSVISSAPSQSMDGQGSRVSGWADAIADVNSDWAGNLQLLRDARKVVSLVQHHDAITGGSSLRVSNDWVEKLRQSRRELGQVISESVSILMAAPSRPEVRLHDTHTVIDVGSANTTLVMFNPLPWWRKQHVSVLVNTSAIRVVGPNGAQVQSQVLSLNGLDSFESRKLSNFPNSRNVYRLVFPILIPGLSLSSYNLAPVEESHSSQPALESPVKTSFLESVMLEPKKKGVVPSHKSKVETTSQQGYLAIENEKMRILFAKENGQISAIVDKSTGVHFRLASLLGLAEIGADSGAYVANHTSAKPMAPLSMHLVTGPIVQEVQQVYDGVKQTTRLFSSSVSDSDVSVGDSDSVDLAGAFEVIIEVDSIPTDSELVLRLETDIRNDQKAIFNDGVSSIERGSASAARENNYFPMTSSCMLHDGKDAQHNNNATALSLVSRHSIGIGLVEDGALDLILHRRFMKSDGQGPEENVNDTSPVRIQLVVQAGKFHEVSESLPELQAIMGTPLRSMVLKPKLSKRRSANKGNGVLNELLREEPAGGDVQSDEVGDVEDTGTLPDLSVDKKPPVKPSLATVPRGEKNSANLTRNRSEKSMSKGVRHALGISGGPHASEVSPLLQGHIPLQVSLESFHAVDAERAAIRFGVVKRNGGAAAPPPPLDLDNIFKDFIFTTASSTRLTAIPDMSKSADVSAPRNSSWALRRSLSEQKAVPDKNSRQLALRTDSVATVIVRPQYEERTKARNTQLAGKTEKPPANVSTALQSMLFVAVAVALAALVAVSIAFTVRKVFARRGYIAVDDQFI